MAKRTKNYKASLLHGVRISASTKREFYSNKNAYKAEGIKSAYALQIQKNRDAILKRAATRAAKKAIAKAFDVEGHKWETFGYTLEEFETYYKKITEWNEKIKEAEKTGKLPKNIVGKASFPIYKGKINIDRLEKQLEKLKSVSQIKKELSDKMLYNVKISFGWETVELFEKTLKLVPLDAIVATLQDTDIFRPIVESKGEGFAKSSAMYEIVWGSMIDHEDKFDSILLDLLRRYDNGIGGVPVAIK